MRTALLSLCLLLASHAAAQQSDAPRMDAPPPAQAHSPPEVKLVAPGAEPRKSLRFKVGKGTKQRLILKQKMAMKIDQGGREMPLPPLPELELPVDMRVVSVSKDGEIR